MTKEEIERIVAERRKAEQARIQAEREAARARQLIINAERRQRALLAERKTNG